MQGSKSKADGLAEAIAAQIGRGRPRPGKQLEAVKVAARRARVSEAVVRETRHKLEIAGLIEVRHGSGAWVNPKSRWRITERLGRIALRHHPEFLSDVAGFLEEERRLEANAAAAAARDPNERRLGSLVAAARALETLAETAPVDEPLPEYDRRDLAFHRALVHAGANRAQTTLSEAAQRVLGEVAHDWARDRDDVAADLREHREIIAAIEAGDPAAAAAATSNHILALAQRRAERGRWDDG